MSRKFSIKKLPALIEPKKSYIDDVEICSFETSEQLEFYTVWHETLFDKRRELNAESEKERQIIRNEIVRKTKQFLLGSYITDVSKWEPDRSDCMKKRPAPEPTVRPQQQDDLELPQQTKVTPKREVPEQQKEARRQVEDCPQIEVYQPPYLYYVPAKPDLPNGLTILNSTYYKTMPTGKQLMKYKLTKLYNKFRGRQTRRNFVLDKQKAARLESEVSKSHLNNWTAYTALQALRLPESNLNQLSTIAINNNPKLITIPQMLQPPATSTSPQPSPKKGGKNSKKPQQAQSQQSQQQQQLSPTVSNQNKTPMHLVYIDPSDIVTYSNRINPQQIISYKRRPQILPSSATSKKSSAASYDVFEIMEVLVNSDKTNVTITRNANRPAPPGCSIFSQSVNANTPGIVSTQLHLQARAYLDSVGKFYAEEASRIAKVAEDLKNGPSIDEQIGKYIRLDYPSESKDQISESMNSSTINDNGSSDLSGEHFSEQEEDAIGKLEEDILNMLNAR